VLQLYSKYFREKYHQDEALSLAWSFVGGNPVSVIQKSPISQQVTALVREADEEGYSVQQIGMATELLDEILHHDGKCAFVAVENAAVSFAFHRLYKVGLAPDDPRLSVKFIDTLQGPVWELAKETLEFAKALKNRPIGRDIFAQFSLGVQPADTSKLQKPRGSIPRPPVHEV
jgi:hypothetical protein